MIDELVALKATINEIGMYAYLYQNAINEGVDFITRSKNQIRTDLTITYERLEKTLDTLENRYGVIEVDTESFKPQTLIKIVKRSEYQRPPYFIDEKGRVDIIGGKGRRDDYLDKVPAEYNSQDILYYFADKWEKTFDIPYRLDWKRDAGIIARQALGHMGFAPEELVKIINYIFDDHRGVLPQTNERVYSVKVLASKPLMNAMAMEVLVKNEKTQKKSKKKYDETPSVARRRKERQG